VLEQQIQVGKAAVLPLDREQQITLPDAEHLIDQLARGKRERGPVQRGGQLGRQQAAQLPLGMRGVREAREVVGPFDASADRPRLRLSDSMLRLREAGTEIVVHVEVEREWRPEMARRIYQYATAAHAASWLPVVSVVLLLRPGGGPPASPAAYEMVALGRRHRIEYEVVALPSLEAEAMLAQLRPEGWPFLVAMRGANEPLVRAVAKKLRRRDDLSSRWTG